MKKIQLFLIAAAVSAMLAGCQSAAKTHEQTTSTNAPKATDKAAASPKADDNAGNDNIVDDAGDMVQDAGNAVGNTVENAGDAVGNAVENTTDAAGNIVEDAGNAVENMTDGDNND